MDDTALLLTLGGIEQLMRSVKEHSENSDFLSDVQKTKVTDLDKCKKEAKKRK